MKSKKKQAVDIFSCDLQVWFLQQATHARYLGQAGVLRQTFVDGSHSNHHIENGGKKRKSWNDLPIPNGWRASAAVKRYTSKSTWRWTWSTVQAGTLTRDKHVLANKARWRSKDLNQTFQRGKQVLIVHDEESLAPYYYHILADGRNMWIRTFRSRTTRLVQWCVQREDIHEMVQLCQMPRRSPWQKLEWCKPLTWRNYPFLPATLVSSSYKRLLRRDHQETWLPLTLFATMGFGLSKLALLQLCSSRCFALLPSRSCGI